MLDIRLVIKIPPEMPITYSPCGGDLAPRPED